MTGAEIKGRSMSQSAAERETTITSTDDGDTVRIWTNQRRYLGRLRRHPSFHRGQVPAFTARPSGPSSPSRPTSGIQPVAPSARPDP